jgi:hypothetical protein
MGCMKVVRLDQTSTYAVSKRPLPVSLIASLKLCSSRNKPPTKKQNPKQSSIVAKIDPRIAALITYIWSSFSKTMKRTISTIEPQLLDMEVSKLGFKMRRPLKVGVVGDTYVISMRMPAT